MECKERYKGRRRKVERQPKKGTSAGKKRHQDRQGKVQRQKKKRTRAGRELNNIPAGKVRQKGRQEKVQVQAGKRTKTSKCSKAGKEKHKARQTKARKGTMA